MTSSYRILSIEDFGRALHEAGDLDPVYNALVAPGVTDLATRDRWLLAYWTFYHVGVASYLADAETVASYWERFGCAVRNAAPDLAPVGDGRWPRGRERRHMRGINAKRTYMDLWTKYPRDPSGFVAAAIRTDREGPLTCREIVENVRRHVGFGPWISFKVADMLERVVGLAVDFEQAEVFVFDQPKEAALLLWASRATPGALPTVESLFENAKRVRPRDEEKALRDVVEHLTKEFAPLGDAPPASAYRRRPYGLQEVETVLCKWKSHLNGHYPVGLDRVEIYHAAREWGEVSPTAARFAEVLK